MPSSAPPNIYIYIYLLLAYGIIFPVTGIFCKKFIQRKKISEKTKIFVKRNFKKKNPKEKNIGEHA